MATYTSYLNLEKPTTSETFNLLKMNKNWDKIDAGVSALNSNFAKISLDPKNELNGSNDMNNVDVGTYYQSGGSSNMPVNAPSDGNNAFIMVVAARRNDRIQFWYSLNANKLYVRFTNYWDGNTSSNWTKWKALTPT